MKIHLFKYAYSTICINPIPNSLYSHHNTNPSEQYLSNLFHGIDRPGRLYIKCAVKNPPDIKDSHITHTNAWFHWIAHTSRDRIGPC